MMDEAGKDQYSACLFDERLLHLRLDDELSEYRRQAVDGHLARCRSCEYAFAGIAMLKERVAEAANQISAPAKLRDSIILALSEADASGRLPRPAFLEKLLNDRVRLLGVAAVAAAAAFFVFAARQRHFNEGSAVARLVLHEYEEYREEFPRDGIRTNRPHEAEEYFYRQLGHRVSVPGDFGPGIELAGVCVTEIGGGPSTCAIYEADPIEYMLFIVPEKCRSAGQVSTIACGEYLYRRGGAGDARYINWTAGGCDYYLVGRCSHERLLMLAGRKR